MPVSPQNLVPEIMVSYSSQDRAVVMQIVQRLRAAGVAVWIDFGGIDGAQRWGEEIVNAIEASKIVLLMISPTSMESENIAKEVALAWEGGKRFLPLVLADAKIPKSMQYQLAGIQHIRLYDGDPEQKFVSVLRALVRLGVSVSPYYIAMVSAEVGDREQAYEWLEKACEMRSGSLSRLKTDERFQSLHGDPRFNALLERVSTLILEREDVPAKLTIPTARPTVTPVPHGPQPLWKKLTWPDIYDDVSARQATSLGVWASALIVASSIFALVASSIVGPVQTPGFNWSSPVFLAVIFAPIAFGVQKMGRPAAAIGGVLCVLGLFGNFTLLNLASMSLDAYTRIPEQYRSQYPYPNPYPTYFFAWFSILVGIVSVLAFVNAMRGTFAYHDMVATGRATDKQDAISPSDWALTKAGALALFGKGQAYVGGLTKTKARPVQPPPPPPPPVIAAPQIVAAQTEASTLPAVITPAPAAVVSPPRPQLPARVPLARNLFAQMIGAGNRSIDFWHAGVFLLANVAAAAMFYVTEGLPPHAGYWILTIATACILSVVTVLAFRLVANAWLASGAAALVSVLLTLPFHNLLWTFNSADLFYREQFQQFLLLPFIHALCFLLALVILVPLIQILPLAFAVAAFVTEIVAALANTLFRSFGAGAAPDPLLAHETVLTVIVRSIVFGLAMWGGLEYLKIRSAKAYAG